jgi:hypothetical protein
MFAAIAIWISKEKGDSIAQWLDRCYWGALDEGARYGDANQEQADFEKVMAEA